jgi:ribosomal protein L31
MSDITDLSVDVSELTDALLISPKEKTLVSATAATGTINIDVSDQSDVFYTSNATANFTLNIRGNSSTTLSSLLGVGQSITVVFKNTNGSTPYYLTTVQIDGTTVTPKWLISAPSYGTPSGIDSYSLTITKTGSSTFVVFGSQAGYV